MKRMWRVWAIGAVLALGGCRGCGCEEPAGPGLSADAAQPAAPDVSVAESMGPGEVETAITQGLRAVASGDRSTAVARFEAAARADPGRRVPHQRLCGLYRDAGRTADALRACAAWRELETEPDFRARADAIIEGLKGQGAGQ